MAHTGPGQLAIAVVSIIIVFLNLVIVPKLFKTLPVSYSVLVFFAPAILLTASFLIYIVQGFISVR